MNDDAIKELIREIAAEHGIAVDRDDPILILHTASRKILNDVLLQAQQSMAETLARHRSELELASSKWQDGCKRSASQLLQGVQASIAPSVGAALNQATANAVNQLQHVLERHEKAVARSTLACALSAAVAILAAAAVLWASFRVLDRPAVQSHAACLAAGDSTCS